MTHTHTQTHKNKRRQNSRQLAVGRTPWLLPAQLSELLSEASEVSSDENLFVESEAGRKELPGRL